MFGRLPKRSRAKLQPVKSSRAEELLYVQAITRILSQDDAAIRAELDRALPALSAVLRLDGIGDDLSAIFQRLRTVVAVGEAAARNAAAEMLERTQRKNAVQTAEQFQKAGLPTGGLGSETWLREQQSLALAENARLIQGVRGQRLEDVQGILSRGLQSGADVNQIAKEIRARLHISRQRALLIATDQSLKWNAALTRLRQQDAGIDRYKWSTAHDERVRPGHRALDGTVQKWSEPPIDNPATGARHHPGQAVRCRCTAIPVLDFEGDGDNQEGDE